jgi:hypothetical protein
LDIASATQLNDLFVGDSNAIGSLTVSNGGTVEAANVIIGAMGEVRGNGMIMGDIVNGGLVSPGASPGVLNVDGDYAQNSGGELVIDLASPVNFDQLLITGDATLGGKLSISLLDGFIPSIGQVFTIITSDDVDGPFLMEEFPSMPGRVFDVIYNPQSVVLTVLPAFTADFDEDGDVDSADLAQWQGDFGENAASDADNDGDSDGADFLAWQQQFGSPPPPAAAVPEPCMSAILWMDVASIGFYGRRRFTKRRSGL